MTDYMVVSFEPTGEVTAIHRDTFDLGFLGKQQITRASELLFNEATQDWAVHLPVERNGITNWETIQCAKGFATYDTARRFEVKWLEACSLRSVEPLSPVGISICIDLRREFK